MNFNSSLVRLKEIILLDLTTSEIYFNSSLVRLKVTLESVTGFTFKTFQFQFGTIKSFSYFPSPIQENNFNFSLVRLKDQFLNFVNVSQVLFQFQFGTIKRFFVLGILLLKLIYFNSSLVRLKVISI